MVEDGTDLPALKTAVCCILFCQENVIAHHRRYRHRRRRPFPPGGRNNVRRGSRVPPPRRLSNVSAPAADKKKERKTHTCEKAEKQRNERKHSIRGVLAMSRCYIYSIRIVCTYHMAWMKSIFRIDTLRQGIKKWAINVKIGSKTRQNNTGLSMEPKLVDVTKRSNRGSSLQQFKKKNDMTEVAEAEESSQQQYPHVRSQNKTVWMKTRLPAAAMDP